MHDKHKERGGLSPSPLKGERAGVRGENVKSVPIAQAHREQRLPHLTLPSPLPPGAERERRRSSVLNPAAQAITSLFVVVPS